MNFLLNEEQAKTLLAIADGFLHEVPFDEKDVQTKYADIQALKDLFKRSASDLKIRQQLETILLTRTTVDKAKELTGILSYLSTSIGCFTLTGYARPFYQLTNKEREQVLYSWSTSSIQAKRKLFSALKVMLMGLFFTILQDRSNPSWAAMGYPGADPNSVNAVDENEFVYKVEDQSKIASSELECDVVVIGSGAGGGIVAGELATAGYKVIVVEKGIYCQSKDLPSVESESMEMLYENGGVIFSDDSGLAVFAGSTFGGGTTINWAASFRTPKPVLEEWAKTYGLKHFLSPEFERSMDAVLKAGGVHDNVVHNGPNGIFKAGCEALNLHHGDIPHNADGAHECGFCGFGCKRGLKNAVTRTFLKDAAKSGNCKFLVQCEAEKVVYKNGVCYGVIVNLNRQKKAFIKAKVTVVSGGSLNSPALLLKSKVPNKNIGKNLRLHPVGVIYGIFEQTINPFEGCIMSWYSDALANRDGKFYGVKLETPAVHPGVFGMATPFESSKQFKRLATYFPNMAVGIAIVRDTGSGEVTVDENGKMRFNYSINKFDLESLSEGIEAMAKMLVAAGAKEINCGVHGIESFKVKTPKSVDDTEFKQYLKKVKEMGSKEFSRVIFSAHQMGSCRMGTSPSNSVVNPNGESWEVKNLYVADASTFPTPSGSNPMMTTEAIAHFISQKIKLRLQEITQPVSARL